MIPLRLIIKSVPVLSRGFKTSAKYGGEWTYRTAPPPPPKSIIMKAEIMGAFMWWWILYHLFTEPEHITGEFPYPDVSKWTNAELGIPPDDED
ncbi:NADH dehydrogenase [ubiquinone] 1 beta subcomplex subunit 2, mitochondrial isoform X1 [Cherax quadricarinatus]